MAVRCFQQVLGVSSNLGHQTGASRTADLPVAAEGLLRGGRVEALFGLQARSLRLRGAGDQLRRDEEVWDLVRRQHVAVGWGHHFLVSTLTLSQHTGLHRATDLIQNPHGPTRQCGSGLNLGVCNEQHKVQSIE